MSLHSLIMRTLSWAQRRLDPRKLESYRGDSYSQEGEDRILIGAMGNRGPGFYVDVGAHHPFRFSNTYLFYQLGWHGINIDAAPGSMEQFIKFRPLDINLEVGVGNSSEPMTFHIFNEPALNSFSAEFVKSREGQTYKVIKKIDVPVKPLSQILHAYLPKNTTIDFMSIDVEGYDLEVLKSNDWSHFRPSFILVELLTCRFSEITSDPVSLFLIENGYRPIAKTLRSTLFENIGNANAQTT